ncbi:conserved hypothetical protein [Methanothermus fervidus DSM 2088]|uniref:Amidohydrolase 2 n=1 Tax=Methanothermus fervidus (strain ATCC 43054 / DSM 2088 / JCM 10308 / V24 S) TaxID=523846 RepID=E3GYW8_METFV|nr:conserved hypothetical protein [Methanothermus fervidus DSM 2088]
MLKRKLDTSEIKLEGMIDTHVHTKPDIKPRLKDDISVAKDAKKEKMKALVIKSHGESTVGRAQLATDLVGIDVFGGIVLNENVGGINPNAVEVTAKLGGKIVWLPTVSIDKININKNSLEDVIIIVAENDMVLATGHLKPSQIFQVLDIAQEYNLKKILINHPLTKVVGANLDEQKEMGKYGFLEHCFVACMPKPKHDGLDVTKIVESIKYVGYKRCILATDFGQIHNPPPVLGLKIFIKELMCHGISWKHVKYMTSVNPKKLLYM